MARTAVKAKTAEVPLNPAGDHPAAAARRAVVARVTARRPPAIVQTYGAGALGRLTVTEPDRRDRLPAASLGDWCDDRVMATFGGRVRLTPAQQCAFDVLEAARGGDPAACRRAVRAGAGLDAADRYLVWLVLAEWRQKAVAGGFASEVMRAALGEAELLGWDRRPRPKRTQAA